MRPGGRKEPSHLETFGYDAVGTQDLIIGDGTPGFGLTLVLAAVAAATGEIKLEFGVLTLRLRPTAWVAAQIQTLRYLPGNRVVLGVGIGGFPGSPFWLAAGAPRRGERGRRAGAAQEVLPRVIQGEEGLENVVLAPTAPAPPILIGGTPRPPCAAPCSTATAGRPPSSPRRPSRGKRHTCVRSRTS